MKEIKEIFSVSTKYVNSTVKEEVTIEVGEDATKEEIMNELFDYHNEWMHNNMFITHQISI